MARLIAFNGLSAAPWKNGGGSTTELAVYPAGAGFDDFDWRISVASIARSVDFSIFPGIDRSLALVDGIGVSLAVDDGAPVRLTSAAPLIHFAGESHVHARVDAPSRDFNVMTRRSRCRHIVRVLTGPGQVEHEDAVSVLFLTQGTHAQVYAGTARFTLGRFDALLLEQGDASCWQLQGESAMRLLLAGVGPA